MQNEDHFRINQLGTRKESLYFNHSGLGCTCYNPGGPSRRCSLHPFGKRRLLSHHSQRSCQEVFLAYGNAWNGQDEELIHCIMTQSVLAMMVGIFDYTSDHIVRLSQAYGGFNLKPLLDQLVEEHFRRNVKAGMKLRTVFEFKKIDNFDRLDIFNVTVDEVVSRLKELNTVDVEGVGVSCHFDKDDFDFLIKCSERMNQILGINEIGHSFVQVESHEHEYEEEHAAQAHVEI